MRKAAILGAAAIIAGHAHAAEFQIDVENFTASNGIAEVVIKVTNQTGRAVEGVFINCVFLNKDNRAIDIGYARISSLAAGASTYEKAAIGQSDGVQFVTCEVKNFS